MLIVAFSVRWSTPLNYMDTALRFWDGTKWTPDKPMDTILVEVPVVVVARAEKTEAPKPKKESDG
jgi:hypothetical protein